MVSAPAPGQGYFVARSSRVSLRTSQGPAVEDTVLEAHARQV